MHSFTWNTHSHCSLDEVSPRFHGVLKRDPVTDEMVVYYPTWKRRLWYLVSVLAMLPLLAGGVAIMTLSLNLNGYVQNKNSPIYVARLAQYAAPVSVGGSGGVGVVTQCCVCEYYVCACACVCVCVCMCVCVYGCVPVQYAAPVCVGVVSECGHPVPTCVPHTV